MLSHKLFEAYKIDNLEHKWSVRILFLVLLCLEFAFYFVKIGDSDFSEFFAFYDNLASSATFSNKYTLADIPITTGNVIYLLYRLLVILSLIMGSIIYSAIFIRDFRKNKRQFHIVDTPISIFVKSTSPEDEEGDASQAELLKKVSGLMPEYKPIGVGAMILRILLIAFLAVALIIPEILIIEYLPLIVMLTLPCLMLSLTYYISGDKYFFEAFIAGFKQIRGNFMEYMTGFCVLCVSYIAVEFVLLNFDYGSMSKFVYAALSFATPYFVLALGRYMGIKHCLINDAFAQLVNRKSQM